MTKTIIKEIKTLTVEEVVNICKAHEHCYGCPLCNGLCICTQLDKIDLDAKVEIQVDIAQDNTTEKYKSKTERR